MCGVHRIAARRRHIPHVGDWPRRFPSFEGGRPGACAPIGEPSPSCGSRMPPSPPRRAQPSAPDQRNWSQAIMERKAHRSGRFLVRLLLLSLAGIAAAALQRERKAVIEPELDAPKPREREAPDSTFETSPARRRLSTPRRLAVGFALTAIFFAGAAFTAGAGNEVAGLLEDTASTDTTLTSSSAPDASAAAVSTDPAAAPAPETSTDAAPSAPADSSSSDASASDDDAPATGHGSSAAAQEPAPAASDSSLGGGSGALAPAATPAPVTPSPKPAAKPHRAAKRKR